MASFGEKRLEYKVMYLATIREDGYPRVHPFTPFIGSGRLFAFMEPTSPKAKDLQRNCKYSMHSLVTDQNGTSGEFQISGDAFLLSDSASREAAIASCPYKPSERYILFEFRINRCFTNYYTDGRPNAKHWKE
jgi:Pyridoxamine 5'-phosphate oxidase